jgi:hypothetical protein
VTTSAEPVERPSIVRLFTLSLRRVYADMILSGDKRWEFRANPRFGASSNHHMSPGDVLFLVSTSPAGNAICIACLAGRILRGQQLVEYFGAEATGHWMEAGCKPGTERDFVFFQREILSCYATAVELLRVRPVAPPIACAEITKLKNGVEVAWSGRGFSARKDLLRLRYRGEPLVEVLGRLASGA